MAKVSNAQLQQQLESFSERFEEMMKSLTTTTNDAKTELAAKIDGINVRLDSYDTRFNKLEESVQHTDNRLGELAAQLENGDLIVSQKFNLLTSRIVALEQQVQELEGVSKRVGELEELPNTVDQLREEIENRTNRSLRETLVFKNIPEEEGENSYKETKELLATTINRHCPEITYEVALNQIKRAHRERNRNFDDYEQSRQGKRIIYAAFHSWDLCQKIIESFRVKCIKDRNFNISVDQKYGPLTTKRRQKAFLERKKLKEEGVIASGYVAFPAKLMINLPGDVDGENKKVYKLHTNFSRAPVP